MCNKKQLHKNHKSLIKNNPTLKCIKFQIIIKRYCISSSQAESIKLLKKNNNLGLPVSRGQFKSYLGQSIQTRFTVQQVN